MPRYLRSQSQPPQAVVGRVCSRTRYSEHTQDQRDRSWCEGVPLLANVARGYNPDSAAYLPRFSVELNLTHLFKHSDGVCEFAPLSVIFEEDSAGDYLYVLLEGEVTVSIKQTDVWQLRAGDIFGEMALIDHRPRSATAIARTSVRAVRIDEARFLYMVQQTPYFSLHVMRVMAERLRALDETLS